MLNKEQILKAKDITIKIINVPEWGGDVGIRVLKGWEKAELEAEFTVNREKTLKTIREKLCAMAICDEDGNSVFSLSDMPDLANKSANALERVFFQIRDLSGLSDESVDGLAKNSEAVLSEDSILD